MTDQVNRAAYKVVNNVEENRFEVDLGQGTAVLEYSIDGDQIIMPHTEVPSAFRGQGIAEQMTKVALEYAKAENLTVVPACPFVSGYIRRHKEYQPLTGNYQDNGRDADQDM